MKSKKTKAQIPHGRGRVATVEADRVVRLPEVMAIVGLGKTQIYEDINSGEFPDSFPLSGRARGWRLSKIRAWMDKREALGAKRKSAA